MPVEFSIIQKSPLILIPILTAVTTFSLFQYNQQNWLCFLMRVVAVVRLK